VIRARANNMGHDILAMSGTAGLIGTGEKRCGIRVRSGGRNKRKQQE